jgi:radical SAM protein with 4Fe4S-binding SPASM domain
MIDKNNKVFCISPWIHLHTWPNETVYPCCLTPMNFPVGNLSNQTLEEVWNDNPMRQLRQNMINGIKSDSCQRCYAFEAAGQTSMRNSLNKKFQHHFEEVEKTSKNGTYDKLNLVYWDFRFSNICNFKCRMCGPQLSTGWYSDTKKIYGMLPTDVPTEVDPNKLWKQIEPLFETVEEIYFAGGEPLIMEEHYRILKKLDEMKRYDVRIRYNSNFSQLIYKSLDVLDIWPKFDTVEMYASIDGSQGRGEFIRKGLEWNTFLSNRQQLKEKASNVRFVINYTVTALNAFHSVDFHKEMVTQKIIDDPNNLLLNLSVDPAHLSAQILPKNYKDKLNHLVSKYIDELQQDPKLHYITNNFKSLINFVESDDKSNLLYKFNDHMLKLDNIRGESWKLTFPEIAGITNE